jgi:hypothetical protein
MLVDEVAQIPVHSSESVVWFAGCFGSPHDTLGAVVALIRLPAHDIYHYVVFSKIEQHWVCFNNAVLEVVDERRAVHKLGRERL